MPRVVERWTFTVKFGHEDELIELSKAGPSTSNLGTVRYYRPLYGPMNIVILDWEFETQEQDDRVLAEYFSRPEVLQALKKISPLIESGTHERLYIY